MANPPWHTPHHNEGAPTDVRIRRTGLPARILVSALGAAAVSFAATGGAARAEAGDGISATGATVDKVGWWHEKNVATETPAAIVTVPPPPGVPGGTLAVGAVNGDADRLTAIGILPDAVPGDTITSFTLTIKEAASPAVNANSTGAKIVACPITSFWVKAENGTWVTKPEFDCELAKAAGTRAASGTWSFNLLPIGEVWTDPAGTVTADGIVLVEDVDTPEAFQTVFATEGEGALVVSISSTPGEPPTTEPTVAPPFEDTGGSFDPGAAGGFEVPDLGFGSAPVGGLPAPAVTTPTTNAQAAPPTATTPVASSSPNVLGNLPGGLVLAVPLFLALLALLSFSLGPAGEPAVAGRQRGVSRALAARERPTPVTATPPEAS